MYGNTSVLIMGEAKRRKNLGIPPREKNKMVSGMYQNQLPTKNDQTKYLGTR